MCTKIVLQYTTARRKSKVNSCTPHRVCYTRLMTESIALSLDLANHHAGATPEEIKLLCENVLKYGFNAAFVNPYYIALARQELGDRAKVGCTISFPLGQDTTERSEE